MKCVICKQGNTKPGVTTLTLEKNGLTFVVKNVPANVCENCGEAYIDEKTTADLLESAESLSQSGTVVDIRSFISA